MSEHIYFPPRDADGGWRWLDPADSAVAGMDPVRLDTFARAQEVLYGGFSWSMAIIRHGHLVREMASFNVLSTTRFDVWSGTKSFAATAWGLLLSGRLTDSGPTLDTPIYDLIPAGRPLTDPGKADITVGQVLTMTAGFRGETGSAFGTPTDVTAGPFEYILGRAADRSGDRADILAAEPGTRWDYSDVGYAHLTLAFANAAGREIADVMQEYVFDPIGIEQAAWDVQGGSGYLGPHTNPHTGLHLSARELARFGYLALHGGEWNGDQVIPADWQKKATQPSQELNRSYGYGWWTNAHDTYVPGAPTDLFALAGFAGNRCYIIPSLDLVIARVGTGPFVLDERGAVLSIVAAVIDR